MTNHRELARSIIAAILAERRGFLAAILQRADPDAVIAQTAFWVEAVEVWLAKNVPEADGEVDALVDIVRRLEALEAAREQSAFVPSIFHGLPTGHDQGSQESPCPACGATYPHFCVTCGQKP